MNHYNHWRLETDLDHILWVYFDKKNANANTIDLDVLNEFSAILQSVAQTTQYKGMIITSAKKSGFIAGADINQFKKFNTQDDAYRILKEGQNVFKQLAELKIPTVALIEGFCLGGGLELALACHYRVAEDGIKTRLGLPEVKLGIYPGWGGSVRLPRLLNPLRALPLILSGRLVGAKEAEKIGLVHAAVPKRHLLRAAKFYATQSVKPHSISVLQSILNSKPLRFTIAGLMRKQLRKKVNPAHYPAPFQVLDNWEHINVYHDQAFEQEAKNCSKLFLSETSQNLVRVFFLQEKLKAFAKESDFSPAKIHVIGAGTMGGGIAAWCALRGMEVTLQDREPKLIEPAIKRAYQIFKSKLKEPYLIQRAMDRLKPDMNGQGMSKADVIIEAVFEDVTIKQTLFKEIESLAKPHAILATNTSSIPLEDIASVLKMPERLVGIHFFNPVDKMPLIEVVQGKQTNSDEFQKALSFVRKIDRLPLPVKSSPGFLINRILMPYLLESFVLLEEGINPATIDKAMLQFGMPMGPIELVNVVGLPVCLSAAHYLGNYFPNAIPEKLKMMVAEKKLTGRVAEGVAQFHQGKYPSKMIASSDEKLLNDIADRLIATMLKEARAALHEQVVTDVDLIDAGMIFGTGFAPFRGGLMHYAKHETI